MIENASPIYVDCWIALHCDTNRQANRIKSWAFVPTYIQSLQTVPVVGTVTKFLLAVLPDTVFGVRAEQRRNGATAITIFKGILHFEGLGDKKESRKNKDGLHRWRLYIKLVLSKFINDSNDST